MINTAHKGKTVKLFMADGTPQGVQTAEIMNWTGFVVTASRAKLAELVQRPELSSTGIYFLTGPDPDSAGKMRVYIGESDDVKKRLIQHNKDENKDFWDKACVLISKDSNLTKAHVRYLEIHLIKIAKDFGHVRVHNSNDSGQAPLPEPDIADMEYFISQIRVILPVLGLEFLREIPEVSDQSSPDNLPDNPRFVAQSRRHNVQAIAQEIEGDFIVRVRSEARAEWAGAFHPTYTQLHKELIADGRLVVSKDDESKAIFQKDTIFKSPSAASAVVLGRSSNGRTDWKVEGTDQTYADWQNEQIENAIR